MYVAFNLSGQKMEDFGSGIRHDLESKQLCVYETEIVSSAKVE